MAFLLCIREEISLSYIYKKVKLKFEFRKVFIVMLYHNDVTQLQEHSKGYSISYKLWFDL